MAEPLSEARPILTGSAFGYRNVLRQMLDDAKTLADQILPAKRQTDASVTTWNNISQDVAA